MNQAKSSHDRLSQNIRLCMLTIAFLPSNTPAEVLDHHRIRLRTYHFNHRDQYYRVLDSLGGMKEKIISFLLIPDKSSGKEVSNG